MKNKVVKIPFYWFKKKSMIWNEWWKYYLKKWIIMKKGFVCLILFLYVNAGIIITKWVHSTYSHSKNSYIQNLPIVLMSPDLGTIISFFQVCTSNNLRILNAFLLRHFNCISLATNIPRSFIDTFSLKLNKKDLKRLMVKLEKFWYFSGLFCF